MSRVYGIPLLCVLGACGGDSPRIEPAQGAADPANALLSLEWSLALADDGAALVVDYTVRSAAPGRVYVCDQLTLHSPSFRPAGDRLVLLNPESAGQPLRLVCGATSPDIDLYYLHKPIFAALEPGEARAWSKRVPRPLTTWHNLGPVAPLAGAPTHATLTLDWLEGEPTRWRELHEASGATWKVPEYGAVHQLHGRALPLP